MDKTSPIFTDADAIISLYTIKDSNHKRAIELSEIIAKENRPAITCTYTLLEIATILNMKTQKGLGAKVAKRLLSSDEITVINGDNFLSAGLEILEGQASKNISLNDCVYFAIAKHFGIKDIFSFDKHWEKNNFKLLNAKV